MTDDQRRLDCRPRGICSWTFALGDSSLAAEVRIHALGERGELRIGAQDYEVRKSGLASGHWTLAANDEIVYSAQKATPFQRTFAFDGPFAAQMHATSAFLRAMELRSGRHMAVVAPVHAFTRRATIVGSWPDDRLVVFAFWLTALLWRRAARRN